MTNNTILFLGASWEQQALIESILDNGIKIIATGEEAPDYIDKLEKFIPTDSSDILSIYQAATLYNVDSIISDNCDYNLLSSELASNILKLPSLGLSSARISNNKLKQRDLASKKNINQPIYKQIFELDDVISFIRSNIFNTIIKPIDSRGSIGITYIDKKSDEKLISRALAKALYSSPTNQLIIEEYIEGELVTIDGFLSNGILVPLAIAKRNRTSEGLTVTTEIFYYSEIDPDFTQTCIEFLVNIKDALGFENGHIHCEALVDKNGKLWFVECTNRGAGVFTSSTINPYVSGIDINQYLLDIKMGFNKDISAISDKVFSQKDGCLLFPSLGTPGKIVHSYNLKRILEIDEVLAFKLFTRLGRPIGKPTDGPSRHFAIALKTSKKETTKDIINYIINDHFKIL